MAPSFVPYDAPNQSNVLAPSSARTMSKSRAASSVEMCAASAPDFSVHPSPKATTVDRYSSISAESSGMGSLAA